MKKAKIFISGTRCVKCAKAIESSLKKLKGVIKANVNFITSKAQVLFNEKDVHLFDIQKTIEKTGVFFCIVERIRWSERKGKDA